MTERYTNPDAIARRPSHAGRGIGRAIVEGFGRRAALVGVADVNPEDVAATVAAIEAAGGRAVPLQFDVADYPATEAALSEAAAALGGPFDTVINNAGISPKHDGAAHRVWEMDPAEWNRVVAVNLTGSFNTVRALSPAMCAAGRGWIVNLSSVAGKTYSPIVACHYAASKAGLIGLTKHLAAELGPFGIRVNAIAPGRIETPMGRLGAAEEVADLAFYLTSAEASFVTGQTVDVAGGLYMT
ncbi:3-oxoacyl-[acyl-carrier protein] reductase [Methylobacterium sp. OAE515]|uniref:SDR family oxidoreductase n=1 Tax=Methylobacterium sp. OAE515 TaxID=2817895 RepID=UPI0017894DFC